MDHQITDITFRPANRPDSPNMLGWVSCIFDGLFLNNMKVKRVTNNRIIISYPRYSTGSNDHAHFYFNPVTSEARWALDDAIFTHIKEIHRT